MRRKGKPKLISLIILSCNGKDDTLELLRSLKKTSYPIREIILVDNGSTDGTITEVRRKFPTVRIIENKKNLGVAVGWNMGIHASTGDYVMLMPNDMVIYKSDWLTKLVEAMESDRRIMLARYVTMIGSKPYRIERGIKGHKGEIDRDQFTGVYDVEDGVGLINKKIFKVVGLYDEKLFCYFEDKDFVFRVKRAGYRTVIVHDSKVIHKGASTVRRLGSYFKYYNTYRGKLRFILKNYSLPKKIPSLILNLGYYISRFVYHTTKGEPKLGRAFIDAIIWNAKNWTDYI